MYSVLAQLTIQPHQVDAFITLFREHARESLREEVGSLGFEAIQDEADPTHFYFHETYADAAAFHTHMQGAISARNFPRMAALVNGNLDSSVYIAKGVTIVAAETPGAGPLLAVVEAATEWLRRIGDPEAARKNTPGTWSKKKILGHLLDSAVNNHHRFVRAQQVEELIFPAYAQEHWVSSQGYQERPWSELVDLWRLYNRHLAHVISRIPEERLAVMCVVGADEPVTLGYLIEDYIVHLKHHLHELR